MLFESRWGLSPRVYMQINFIQIKFLIWSSWIRNSIDLIIFQVFHIIILFINNSYNFQFNSNCVTYYFMYVTKGIFLFSHPHSHDHTLSILQPCLFQLTFYYNFFHSLNTLGLMWLKFVYMSEKLNWSLISRV